jgi:hypothetical protein
MKRANQDKLKELSKKNIPSQKMSLVWKFQELMLVSWILCNCAIIYKVTFTRNIWIIILTFRVCPKQFVQLFWITVCQRWIDVIAMSMAIIYFLSFMSNLGLFRHCAKLSMRKYNICTYLIQLPLTPNNDKNDVNEVRNENVDNLSIKRLIKNIPDVYQILSMAIIYFLSFMSNLGLFRHCATGRCWPLTVRIWHRHFLIMQ